MRGAMCAEKRDYLREKSVDDRGHSSMLTYSPRLNPMTRTVNAVRSRDEHESNWWNERVTDQLSVLLISGLMNAWLLLED